MDVRAKILTRIPEMVYAFDLLLCVHVVFLPEFVEYLTAQQLVIGVLWKTRTSERES